MTAPAVLVVRPEPQASAMARRLSAAGWDVTVEPMLEIALRSGVVGGILDLQPPATGLLVTSVNGIAALAADPDVVRLAALPLLAVGPATAARARKAGFDHVIVADGTAESLVEAARRLPGGEGALVHVAGRDRAGDLAATGREVVTVEAYAAEMADRGNSPAIRDLAAGRFHAVVAASARTSEALRRSLRTAGLQHPLAGTALVTLSEAAALPLKGLFPRRILADPGVDDALTKAVVALAPAVPEDGADARGSRPGQEAAH